ncbi:hypothetical protein VNO80_01256 [Phaseolus coccineus]|uniref:Uncharacterized protein n=1 Tax=Phaseolus coccineus TaxID=3886 RepID=A0AAN9RSJ2_PHACN
MSSITNTIIAFQLCKRKLFTKEEKLLLNKQVRDLATATSDKWLPMHTLAACGEFDLLDALLKHNVDINARIRYFELFCPH